MSISNEHLGGRLALLDESQLSEQQHAVWDRLTATQIPEARNAGFVATTPEGQFIGPFNAFLHFPGPGGALLDWAKAQTRERALSAVARQVVTLAVGAVWQAPFEVQAHVAGAASAGLGQEAIDAVLRREDHADLPDDARVARRVADALLVEHRVDPALYASAVSELGEGGVAAVAHLVGQYVAISALLIAFDVPAADPLDTAPTD